MRSINVQEHVCNIVTENPRRAEIFDKYRIEYCCGGKLSLKEVCEKKKIDLQELIAELQQVDTAEKGIAEAFNLEKSSLSELVDHIVSTHHRYLVKELPIIKKLLMKVIARHGDDHVEFKSLHEPFETFTIDILEHMSKEENVLFPWIRRIDSETNCSESTCGDIKNPIAVLMHEHDISGEFLEKFRNLTNDYTPFEGACPTVRVLLQKLHDLERDTHKHVHMENHVLFPGVITKVGGL